MDMITRFDLLKTRDRLHNSEAPSAVMIALNAGKTLQEAELIKKYSNWKKI